MLNKEISKKRIQTLSMDEIISLFIQQKEEIIQLEAKNKRQREAYANLQRAHNEQIEELGEVKEKLCEVKEKLAETITNAHLINKTHAEMIVERDAKIRKLNDELLAKDDKIKELQGRFSIATDRYYLESLQENLKEAEATCEELRAELRRVNRDDGTITLSPKIIKAVYAVYDKYSEPKKFDEARESLNNVRKFVAMNRGNGKVCVDTGTGEDILNALVYGVNEYARLKDESRELLKENTELKDNQCDDEIAKYISDMETDLDTYRFIVENNLTIYEDGEDILDVVDDSIPHVCKCAKECD